MDFVAFKDSALQFIATGALTYLAWQVNKCTESIGNLNVEIAKVVAHMENHKEDLENHNDRITRLEEKVA
jgi:chromosome segregation ATPase